MQRTRDEAQAVHAKALAQERYFYKVGTSLDSVTVQLLSARYLRGDSIEKMAQDFGYSDSWVRHELGGAVKRYKKAERRAEKK